MNTTYANKCVWRRYGQKLEAYCFGHPAYYGCHEQRVTDDVEREEISADLHSVDETLMRVERQLNNRFQRLERRLPPSPQPQVTYVGPCYRVD